jgi:hypothetical protein
MNMNRMDWLGILVLTSLLLGGNQPLALAGQGKSEAAAPVIAAFNQLPLLFIENRDQLDPQVTYYLQGSTTAVYFTSTGVTFALSSEQAVTPDDLMKTPLPPSRERWVVKLDFRGANPAVKPQAESPQEARISYFTGPPTQWRMGLKTYGQLRYPDLWPGIDLIYTGTANRLKYHFEVKPGADPQQIRLAYRGASSVMRADAGQLEIATPVQHFQDERPVAYQEIDGRRLEVTADYALEPAAGDSQPYGFRLGPYDPTWPLVLNPAVTVYVGYIGGSINDSGYAIAVDAAGNAYVTGHTWPAAASFPVKGGPDLTHNGFIDAFVAKVRADGTGLIYAGYIGGSEIDYGSAIAVDGMGNAYVAGSTESTAASFPVKGGPDLSHNGGERDAFVAKVTADGTDLVYAGYIGGKGAESGSGIAVDGAGNAYVTGSTQSTEASFPVKVGPDLSYNGGEYDAFVAKVTADGTDLVYAGYIGGNSFDYGVDIAVDAAGNAYVTGSTQSTEASFPVKVGPDLSYNGGEHDAFVAKITTDGTGLVYAGYIGGSGDDRSYGGMAVDGAGNAYLTGWTSSTEASFPVKVGPDLTYNGGEHDAFVAKVTVAGTDLAYAGYIGGSNVDYGRGIAVDRLGNAYVMGDTDSTEASFPVKVGPDLSYNGGDRDAFVAKVRADGTDLTYAGYIGGNDYDGGSGIAVDGVGNAYVTGYTRSTEASFLVRGGPDLTYNGVSDVFVAKISAYPAGRNVWYLDDNGNGAWNNCTNDRCYSFGLPGDIPIAGDWNGDGRDEIGVKRGLSWYLDDNGNGDWNGCTSDRCYTFGLAGDIPIAGDWNGDGFDEIGVKRGNTWYLDFNGNGIWNGCTTDRCYTFGLAGDMALAGDWNGDGRDEIGVKRGPKWYLDYNGNGAWDNCLTDGCYAFGLAGDVPVAGDWNGDGRDKIGVKRGHRWYLDTNGNGAWNNCTTDRCYTFGLTGDVPVTGDWGNLGFDAIGVQRPQQ